MKSSPTRPLITPTQAAKLLGVSPDARPRDINAAREKLIAASFPADVDDYTKEDRERLKLIYEAIEVLTLAYL